MFNTSVALKTQWNQDDDHNLFIEIKYEHIFYTYNSIVILW